MENFWFTKAIMLEVLQLVTGPIKKKKSWEVLLFALFM